MLFLAMKQGMKSLINLQAQRATASAACMGSSSGANITCEGMFMPKATIRRRRRQTNAKTGAGLQKMRQCLQEINRQQNECKQHLNGCDLARA